MSHEPMISGAAGFEILRIDTLEPVDPLKL
jgi:hypothetical protein